MLYPLGTRETKTHRVHSPDWAKGDRSNTVRIGVGKIGVVD
jgi:hypothetical protein